MTPLTLVRSQRAASANPVRALAAADATAATPDPGTVENDPHTGPLPSDAAPPRRIRAIDGLRGLAVAAVVLYHLFPSVVPGGYLGVDVFFVISGFVITASLIHTRRREGRAHLRRFWIRRAQRLLPALLAMLLLVCAATAFVGDAVAGRLREQVLAALTFTSNWFQASAEMSYFDRTEPPLLQHLWSLAVEEQFYLLWPLVLLAILACVRRPRRRVALVLALAGASAAAMAWFYTPGADPSRLYFGTDTHGFGLLLGAAAALALPLLQDDRSPRSGSRLLTAVQRLATHPWIAIGATLTILLAIGGLADDRAAAYRGGIALVSALTALLLIGFATRTGGPVRTVLTTPAMVWLGERSYGIYLWHWPILVLMRAAFPETPGIVRGAIVAYLTLLIAALSWRFVERPVLRHGFRGALRRWGRGLRADLGLRCTVLTASLAVVAVAAAYALSSAPERGEVATLVQSGQDALDEAGNLDRPAPPQNPQTPPADAAAPLAEATPAEIGAQTVVIGDSVALASAEGLLGAMPGVGVDAVVGRQMQETTDVIRELREAGQLRTYVVVALGTNGDFSTDALDAIVEELGPDHHLVLVTAHGDRDWMETVNDKILRFGEENPTVGVARWDQATAQVTDFAGDGIHFGDQGGTVFADTVVSTLRGLR